ncbi:6309_t:CDS:2 [Paraglomus occultum]|uniref:6309_t:CDS:1 n=1 Tax=Paraglomus occultum TaxID=144539 RepID=A0A9N9GLE8_9GLOM|nr:6309_t:CDS:2 [Paraglomus occultum]
MVGGSGTDNIGPYSIQGTYDKSSKVITFTKQYIGVNANTAWRYKGVYNDELFSGTWDTDAAPNMGNFLIKRVATIERQSDEGSWQGYYFDVNNKGVQMLIYLTVWIDMHGVEVVNGSGTDAVGSFTLDGHIQRDNSGNDFTQPIIPIATSSPDPIYWELASIGDIAF